MVLTAKEIKNQAKPVFQEDPDTYYPSGTLRKHGFARHQCPKCKGFYWRTSSLRDTCGDSNCVGRYEFIERKVSGIEGKISYFDAWEGYRASMTKELELETFNPVLGEMEKRIHMHTAISRYPVVARWRSDVEYVNAGIYDFQPYCVTGELKPPANPLISPQFCLRFNDLDSIGLSGRHFSGFIMLGQHVFNYPREYHHFKDECVEFNLRWLTETLMIPLEEITIIEDVWAGGGNLGPSLELFVGGLEVGSNSADS